MNPRHRPGTAPGLTRRRLLAGTAAGATALAMPRPVLAAERTTSSGPYLPTPESLNTHPVAPWWRAAKFGIFVHWGAYAVPAWGDSTPYHGAEWYSYAMHISGAGVDSTYQHHRATYGEDYLYDRFISRFTAERYDPRAWVDLFQRAGARYFVLTSKHHDGFALFPHAASDRNAVKMGPRRDLVGELFQAARGSGLRRGLYYSLGEFFNPALDTPPWNAYTRQPIPYTGYKPLQDYVSQYLHPHVTTLVDRYDPDVLWGDGEHWHADLGAGPAFKPHDMDWRGDELLAHFYNNAANRPRPKDVMINDRFEASHRDFAVKEGDKSSYSLRPDAWEACLTLGRSWGYDTNEDPASFKSAPQLARLLADIVSKNGNLLLNIGPRPDGTIAAWQSDRLEAVGRWLDTNGAAIYDTTPWTRAEDGDLRYTVGDHRFFVTGLSWPGDTVTLPADLPLASDSRVRMLGDHGAPLQVRGTSAGTQVTLPRTNPNGTDMPFVLDVQHAR